MDRRRIIETARANWVEIAGLLWVAYMLLFAFPALFEWGNQSSIDRAALAIFEKAK